MNTKLQSFGYKLGIIFRALKFKVRVWLHKNFNI